MIVLGNFAGVASPVDVGPVGVACARRLAGEMLTAPARIDVEATHALEGPTPGGKITEA